MNYKNLYTQFCSYCASAPVRDRLKHRNPRDFRLELPVGNIYTESHHILPRGQGGSNDNDNLVDLLPEEHLFAHKLRYKAFGHRHDMLAVRFIVNGLISSTPAKERLKDNHLIENIPEKLNAAYAFISQHSNAFRKLHGWQTDEGRANISRSRKGTFPAVDAITKVSVGSVSVDHPKVLSGEWVHHSKGKPSHRDIGELREATSGKRNPRYCNITDEEMLEFAELVSIQLNEIPSMAFLRKVFSEIDDRPWPKSFTKFRFNGDINRNFFGELEHRTGLTYKPSSKLLLRVNYKEVAKCFK